MFMSLPGKHFSESRFLELVNRQLCKILVDI